MVIIIEDIRLKCHSKLMQLSWQVKKRSRKNLCSLGFTWNQYSVLKNICPGESITLSQLSCRTSRDSSNITALVDLLEERDLVRRIPDKCDRRVIRVELTEDGELVREDVIAKHEAFIKSIFADIDDEYIYDFMKLLDIMSDGLDLSTE